MGADVSYQQGSDLSGLTHIRPLRYFAALVPAVVLGLVAFLIDARQEENDRAAQVSERARLVAANVDHRLQDLLEVTTFCARAPALIERVDFASVKENCGRYADQIEAWVVLVETGELHRQILNTRPEAPAVLPSYPREDERAPLLQLEARSRASGDPGVADIYTGIVYPRGVVGAGQYLRLADGRSAMLYVSTSVQALTEELASLITDSGPIMGLVDPTGRFVAGSHGSEQEILTEAPDWIISVLEAGAAGVALAIPGPEEIGGTWDVGYYPLSLAPGWMATAFEPTPVGTRVWAPLSVPTAVILVGILLSALLIWAISWRDRASRRVAEAQRAGAEAERENREKSRLLSAVAHDIRSPLISLIGSLEMIEQVRGEGTNQIRTARGSAEALLQLVDDILELSFLGSGELRLHPSPVDLRQLAAELLDQTQRLAGRKGLTLQLELDPDFPPVVEVDRLRLQQVLSNLLTNAVKYTEAGTVTLQIRQAKLQPGRVTLELAVIDTGIGLAPEDVPQILREFGRLEREVERREQGAGLGLAIVQRILHALGSALTIDSVVGKGSTFRFRLNLPVATGGAIVDAARPLAGVVILYAEDEPVIRQVTARRLEEAGANVICAVDGKDAFRKLIGVKPDLLLIDLQMPVHDGISLIRRLNRLVPKRPYPTFVLTSHIAGPQAAEARANGADSVFTKPVQVAALAAAFRARRGIDERSSPLSHDDDVRVEEPVVVMGTFLDITDGKALSLTEPLVERFGERTRNELSALKEALEAQDLKRAAELAHRSLGLCQVIGAGRLAGQIREVELAADQGAHEHARHLMDGTEELLEGTVDKMRSILRERQQADPCMG